MSETSQITLKRIGTETIVVPIVGVTPLIVHAWSEKARKAMLDKQQGKPTTKAVRDPEADFMSSRYFLPDGSDGFPATAFKAAIVNACTLFDSMTKVAAKQSIFVHGVGPDQLIPIVGEPYMREDQVRIGQGTTDLRFRACYPEWSADLTIRYVTVAITRESVLALVDAAGLGGVGEWRPSAPKSATGTFGQFAIDDAVLEQAA